MTYRAMGIFLVAYLLVWVAWTVAKPTILYALFGVVP